jgi:hypothetical protein
LFAVRLSGGRRCDLVGNPSRSLFFFFFLPFLFLRFSFRFVWAIQPPEPTDRRSDSRASSSRQPRCTAPHCTLPPQPLPSGRRSNQNSDAAAAADPPADRSPSLSAWPLSAFLETPAMAAAADATATATACAPSTAEDDDAAFTFDSPSDAVVALRRQFAAGLRAHDGRLGVVCRLLRQGHGGEWRRGDECASWQAAALLSWAEHSGRAALLLPMVALLPKELRQSLLKHVLRYTPHLSLLRALLDRCPQLGRQMAAAPLQLALLHSFCKGQRPNADTLRWLLDSLRFAPRDLRSGEQSPLSTLVSQRGSTEGTGEAHGRHASPRCIRHTAGWPNTHVLSLSHPA